MKTLYLVRRGDGVITGLEARQQFQQVVQRRLEGGEVLEHVDDRAPGLDDPLTVPPLHMCQKPTTMTKQPSTDSDLKYSYNASVFETSQALKSIHCSGFNKILLSLFLTISWNTCVSTSTAMYNTKTLASRQFQKETSIL